MNDEQLEEMLRGHDLMQASPQLRQRIMHGAAQGAAPQIGMLTLPRLAAAAAIVVALGLAAEAMTSRGIRIALAAPFVHHAPGPPKAALPQTVQSLRPDSIRSLEKLSHLLGLNGPTMSPAGTRDRSPNSPEARLPRHEATGDDTYV